MLVLFFITSSSVSAFCTVRGYVYDKDSQASDATITGTCVALGETRTISKSAGRLYLLAFGNLQDECDVCSSIALKATNGQYSKTVTLTNLPGDTIEKDLTLSEPGDVIQYTPPSDGGPLNGQSAGTQELEATTENEAETQEEVSPEPSAQESSSPESSDQQGASAGSSESSDGNLYVYILVGVIVAVGVIIIALKITKMGVF